MAVVDHEQWWLRGVTKTDDELPETHTGDSPRAMSTRSSLAVFDADSLVEADKREVQSELGDLGAVTNASNGAFMCAAVMDPVRRSRVSGSCASQ